MGFCFFNNAGVAALHARAAHGVKRVACVDIVSLGLSAVFVGGDACCISRRGDGR